MSPQHKTVGAGISLALLAALLLVLPLGAAPSVQAAESSGQSTVLTQAAKSAKALAVKKKKAAPDNYTPVTSVTFNEPFSRFGTTYYAAREKVLRTINSTTKGATITFASWNIRGPKYKRALIRAHYRGVTVRIIMDRGNNSKTDPNPEVRAIQAEFRKPGNLKRKPVRRSYVKMCVSSCRGTKGIAHTKFFLFDRVGKARNVTMYTSMNATDIAATNQWNDLKIIANNKKVYDNFRTVFKQMWLDKPMANPVYKFSSDKMHFTFYPWKGPKAKGDPDMAILNKVRCAGATGGTGTNGRTRVLLAQDALADARGLAIAKKLVSLKNAGCDVKVVFSLLGLDSRHVLNQGGVPIQQYSYDVNRDGMYDVYLHMKVTTISGNFAGKSNATVTYNGSANWVNVALASDELVVRIDKPWVERRYARWILRLFYNRPPWWGPDHLGTPIARTVAGRKVAAPDPYALMKEEGLVLADSDQ